MNRSSDVGPLDNLKRERFAHAYPKQKGNATKAAIEAGYAEGSAHVQGHRLLSDDKVRDRIAEIMEATEGIELTTEFVQRALLKEVMTATAPRDRINAASWLGKSTGAFVDRVQTESVTAGAADLLASLNNLDPSLAALIAPMLGLSTPDTPDLTVSEPPTDVSQPSKVQSNPEDTDTPPASLRAV